MENNRFPREVALCLSGGAARGAFHLGAVSILEENDIKIKAISGASVGALIGASLACGKDAKYILGILKSKAFKKVFKLNLGKGHIFKINIEAPIVTELIDKYSFEDLEIPFEVTVSNIDTADVEYYNSGNSFREVVLASCAVTPLISPVLVNDKLLVDGGFMDNFPVQTLQKFQYPILGINLYPYVPIRPTSIISWIKTILFTSWQKDNLKKSQLCDIYLTSNKLNELSTYSFKDIDKAYELGRDEMSKKLKEYQEQ